MTTDVKPPVTGTSTTLPWWTPGDTNAFFGLGFNILVNVLTLTGLMIGVVAVPADDVLGTVLPALGVALILGNLYYTLLARRLAARENRTDVTALPYGPSVPHMFIVVFVVMLPVYLGTGDPIYTFLQRFRTARRNRERTDPIVELGWFYKTWNAMRTRQSLKQLKIPMPGEELVVPK